MSSWRRIGSRRLQHARVFDLDEVSFRREADGAQEEFYVLSAPEWINVIPVTDDRRVVLVTQYRFGVEGSTLEIPGGMCDPGESPVEAARRELREETGYVAAELVPLGWVHPNPAIQSNRCHTFLASGLRPAGPPSGDPHESFEVLEVPLAEIPDLIAAGKITHALVVAAFHLLSVGPHHA